MTTPTYPVPNPAAPRRPVAVTVSSSLLYLVVAMQLLNAVLVLTMMGTVVEATQEVLEQDSQINDIGPAIRVMLVIVAVIYALIAVGMAVLALFNNKGKQPSRIITWVFAGLGLCCNLIGLSSSVSSAAVTGAGQGGLSQNQAEAQVAAALPGWYEAASLTTNILTVVALLGAIILLALPASNAYFRGPVQWNAGLHFQPYPGQPGYQGYPGQPGYPAQQGYPQQPYAQPGYPQQPFAQPGHPPQPYAQPGYPQQPYAQPGYPPPAGPGSPSHFGTPQQYGQPGEPAPGLPPYPGQAGTSPPGSPQGPGPWSAPHSSEPSYDPWASPPSTPSAGESSPGSSSDGDQGGDQGGDPPQRSSSGPA